MFALVASHKICEPTVAAKQQIIRNPLKKRSILSPRFFSWWKTHNYVFFSLYQKTHPCSFLYILKRSYKRIPVFGFCCRNTSAFSSKKNMHVFCLSQNARHKKNTKTQKHKKHIPFWRFHIKSRPMTTDPDQKPLTFPQEAFKTKFEDGAAFEQKSLIMFKIHPKIWNW